MPQEPCWPQLLRALIQVLDESSQTDVAALRRVTREVTRSEFDTSRVIFDPESVPAPAQFAAAMDELVARSEDGTLGGLTPRGLLRAHYAHPLALETICLAVGVAFNDAKSWFGPSGDSWTIEQITKLLAYLDDLVEGRVSSRIPNTESARAIELVDEPTGGWRLLDHLRTGGVPYELLLAQRFVGGAWLLHKNKTSKFTNGAPANSLCGELERRGIDFRRSTIIGGEAKQKDLQELSGIPDKRVGVVVLGHHGTAAFAIAFSSARDGGTARANGDGLLKIPVTPLPFAIVLTGPGWALRPETDRLALRFAGRLFTENSISELVDHVEEAST